MPPSASATPPTQTTQRVPNFSSKPIFGGDGGAGGGGESGTAVGDRAGGSGGGEGCRRCNNSWSRRRLRRCRRRSAATTAPSSAFTLASSCRNRSRSVMLLIRATMPMTGAASSSSTIKTNKPSIGAPARKSPLRECGAAQSTPGRAGTARLLRQDSPGRWSRWRRPCGRRGRATGRRATRCGYWASPSARRGAAPARCRARRAAD